LPREAEGRILNNPYAIGQADPSVRPKCVGRSRIAIEYGDNSVSYPRSIERANSAQDGTGASFRFAFIVQEPDEIREMRVQHRKRCTEELGISRPLRKDDQRGMGCRVVLGCPLRMEQDRTWIWRAPAADPSGVQGHFSIREREQHDSQATAHVPAVIRVEIVQKPSAPTRASVTKRLRRSRC